MEQRDFILKQIEQLGEVLAILMGYKQADRPDDGLKYVEYVWDHMLDDNFMMLKETPEDQYSMMLTSQNRLSLEELKIAAELLYHEGELHGMKNNMTKARIAYFRALRLYEYLLKNDTLYDLSIAVKVEKIKSIL